MAKIKRQGFGQVEPNHLSAQKTGQIWAQYPAADEIKILENGQFVKYDGAATTKKGTFGEVNFDGAGEWMMVFNEVKLYDDMWRESYKDFAMIKENYTPGTYAPITSPGVAGEAEMIEHYGMPVLEGQMVPRVIKINVGDIWTTNTLVKGNTSGKAIIELDDEEKFAKGKYLQINATGFLEPAAETGDFQIIDLYTLADGQPAVKVMKIK